MGDSGSYLATAYINYIPPDRSFVYGYFLKWIALAPHSLEPVVITQVVMSIASCCIPAWLLLNYCGLSFRASALLVFLCAIEPLQLLSERYVLTEATATLLFAVLVWIAFSYSRSGRWWLLIGQALAGVLLVSVRVAYLPLVIFSALLVPLLSPRAREAVKAIVRRRHLSLRGSVPIVISLLLSAAACQFLLSEYKLLYRSLFNPTLRPAFLYHDGYFLLSDFAPLVKPEDYPIAQDRAWVFSHVTIPLGDRRNREPQRWSQGGICEAIKDLPRQGEYRGNRMARLTALHAVRRDPGGVFRLMIGSVADYFDQSYLQGTLLTDEAFQLNLSQHDQDYFRRVYGFVRQAGDDDSLTRRWHRFLWPWYPALLLIPLAYAGVLLLGWRYTSAVQWYLLLPAGAVWATSAITVSRPTARFETSLGWLAFLLAGSAWRLWNRRRQRHTNNEVF